MQPAGLDGYAGVQSPLFVKDDTEMLFGVERSREAGWDSSTQGTLDLAEQQGWAVEESPSARACPADLARRVATALA